ncbi:MAG: hypothetical protein KBT03_04665 [Bacteroidales bacterium]|nr:hypothetical protein [Candidatus Scybalousia scybalohippi]
MKILIVEATAEELSANRTVMDSLCKVLNDFTDRLCGVRNWEEVLANVDNSEKENE